MKVEQLLVQHLYDNKEVSLQGIGTFRLASDYVLPSDSDKDFVIPENAISFEYNSRAEEDKSLVDFIVQKTGKIKPLASADLDSYVTLGKQFLNIGKPFRIEGVGTLQKSMTGEYKFTPGQFITPKLQEAPKPLREKLEKEEGISFNNTGRSSGSKKILIIAATAIGLGLLGWGAWYFLNKKKSGEVVKKDEPQQTDTSQKAASSDTTAIAKKDSSTTIPTAGNYTFKIVIKNYPTEKIAQEKYNKLTGYGHKLLIYSKDSVFKVAMPFTTALSDTARARDSVRKKLFGGNPYVELN